MIRFGALVLVIVCICALVLIVSRLIPSRNVSPVAALFTNPDGSPCTLPCMFGIRLGQTKKVEAIALLKSHPLLQTYDVISLDPLMLRSRQEKTTYIRISTTSDGVVEGIALTAGLPPNYRELTGDSYPGSIHLGDAISLLGIPDTTIIYNDLFHANFLRDDYEILAVVPLTPPRNSLIGIRASPNWSINTIMIASRLDCPPGTDFTRLFSQWLGFGTLDRFDAAGVNTARLRTVDNMPYASICQP